MLGDRQIDILRTGNLTMTWPGYVVAVTAAIPAVGVIHVPTLSKKPWVASRNGDRWLRLTVGLSPAKVMNLALVEARGICAGASAPLGPLAPQVTTETHRHWDEACQRWPPLPVLSALARMPG